MPRKRSDTAERILREAMRLFAEKGYERTSVPEIQAAAGLAAGSGALYKHYPSKEAVLRAAVQQYIDDAQHAQQQLETMTLPPSEALEHIGRLVMATMAARHAELRILWRDLEQVPPMHALAREHIVKASYRALASWLEDQAARGELDADDSEAVAAVILGGITMFRAFEALWGERAIDVDDERFLRAWHEIVTRGLGLEPPRPTRGRRPGRSRQAAKRAAAG
jgi:AcrR family transcriptional regulator